MIKVPAVVPATDVLLVTGGGRGIGAAIVRKAARLGYAVCFSYVRDDSAARSLVSAVRAADGRVRAFRGDVACETFAPAFFDDAEAAFGPVTALVNNAGVTGRIGAFKDIEPAAIRRTFEVNVFGAMQMAQEAIRRWDRAGVAGRMVNISSIAATLGAPGEYVHYAATKAAVDGLTIGLAKELAPPGVRINGVSPGTIDTEIHAAAGDPDRPARVAARVPMGRIGKADEIGNAALWLLSGDASYVTGAVLRVSGGL